MADETETTTEQKHLLLTPHPLQRIGAYSLTALAEEGRAPELVSPAGFDSAMKRVARDSVLAASRESKKTDGFWQKVSLSFFPNSPMNHPSRHKGKNTQGEPRTEADMRAAVREWLTCPKKSQWPGAVCVLCERQSVGFFGKRDVPLAESEAYRNTTPRGHEGMALCWPCLCCFYALPYGCHLTGGPSVAVHSWDEAFLGSTVRRHVRHNVMVATTGKTPQSQTQEVVALRSLRSYSEKITDGVGLLIFNNNNRGQLLETHDLQQPLAEWLRNTNSDPELRQGFSLLTRAHHTSKMPGTVALARNAFRSPTRLVSMGLRAMEASVLGPQADSSDVRALNTLLSSFVSKVEQVNEKDLSELRTTAKNIAQVFFSDTSRGGLKELRAKMRDSRQLRSLLLKHAIAWSGRSNSQEEHPHTEGPLLSERSFILLFDPGEDNRAWFHRDLLLVGVLAELSRLGWRATDDEAPDAALAELDEQDKKIINDEEEEEDEK